MSSPPSTGANSLAPPSSGYPRSPSMEFIEPDKRVQLVENFRVCRSQNRIDESCAYLADSAVLVKKNGRVISGVNEIRKDFEKRNTKTSSEAKGTFGPPERLDDDRLVVRGIAKPAIAKEYPLHIIYTYNDRDQICKIEYQVPPQSAVLPPA
eukprot:TRINITY_DN11225_c0_g1_i2.p1 TRINITY_DN11225_c0_g1~~TRINITY_DN11225_c0_g1_i2.p1  ORF type:complete len:152 (-),score=8.77 TRINITY_DN11225_c0_g1_i2:148-603(-)